MKNLNKHGAFYVKNAIIRNALDSLQVSCPSELDDDFLNPNSVSNSLFKLRILMKHIIYFNVIKKCSHSVVVNKKICLMSKCKAKSCKQ